MERGCHEGAPQSFERLAFDRVLLEDCAEWRVDTRVSRFNDGKRIIRGDVLGQQQSTLGIETWQYLVLCTLLMDESVGLTRENNEAIHLWTAP